MKSFPLLVRKKTFSVIANFYNSGSLSQSRGESHSPFDVWKFQPRFAKGVSKSNLQTSTQTSVLGTMIPFPVCIAPIGIGLQQITGTENGELDVAKAAEKLGIGFTLSTFATRGIEDIATFVPSVLRWFQVYLFKDREITKRMVKKAENNGYKAIFVTVDDPVKNSRTLSSLPIAYRLKNMQGSISDEDAGLSHMIETELSWDNITWLKNITDLPIIVKGIMSTDMALEAVFHGVDGIVVSTHGQRQLHGSSAAIDMLPEVVKVVNGKCEVFMDGGIRNGSDVAKAVALGAKTVFVARPILWGIACDGKAGVIKVLEILRDELELAMKFLGVDTIEDLQTFPNLVHRSGITGKL